MALYNTIIVYKMQFFFKRKNDKIFEKMETINIKILVYMVKLNIQLEKDQMAQRQLYISQV